MNYKVTALTPLLVGDGRELSPIDYMVWKDQVNVLDQNRIFRLLARGPRLDGYLAQLRKATKLDFASWGGFAQNFSQRRIPFESPEYTPIWNAAPSESLFIPTFAAGLSGPYLPASALKGALRTGLIFSRWSASTMERLAAAIENDRLPRRMVEAAEASAGASQVKIIGVADSAPAPASAFKVYLTRVASLDTRQPASPQLAWKVAGRGSVPPQRVGEATALFSEMAVPGTSFNGSWDEHKFFENADVARALGWRSVPEPTQITQAVNDYANAQLDAHARYAEMTGLKTLGANVDRLKTELSAVREQPLTCLVALGWGTGFLAKTAFPHTDQEAYRKILRTLPAVGKAVRENLPFPKTRRIVFSGSNPSTIPGWVKLQLQD
jgi:CRISPR-associated protein Csm5